MKIPVSRLRQLLPPGARFKAEFIPAPGMPLGGKCLCSQRQVVRNSSGNFESRVLDGEKAGQTVHLLWKGVQVRQEGQASFVLSSQDAGDFVRFVLVDTSI